MIRFEMLGTVDLRDTDGRELSLVLRRPKLLALLAYLVAARPAGFHRRDELVALLWPELDHAHARNALRQAMHTLRETMGREVFLGRGDEELAVNDAQLWCDVRAFATALDAGDTERALQLHRGALLVGFHLSGARDFERWLEAERDYLRRRACDAARTVAERAEAAGDAVAAVHWAWRLTELSPSDETSMRRLLTLLDRIGDRARAIQAYEEFQRRLARDLELEPSLVTQSLVRGIRHAPSGE